PYGKTVDDFQLAEEAKFLIGFWLNTAPSAPCKTPSAWMREYSSGSALFWGARVRNRIARQIQYIRHWEAYQCSYEQIENFEATWFIDPPYQQAGKHYPCSSKDLDFAH